MRFRILGPLELCDSRGAAISLPAPKQRMLHPRPEVSVQAAAALAGCTLTDATRQLEALADAHLLHEPAAERYKFHDLLRAYAAECAAQAIVEELGDSRPT